jgi:hypothetical protein
MKYLLFLIIATHLVAQTIHSSFSTYYEDKTFKNSKQKEDSSLYGVGADIHHNNSKYRVNYEHSDTKTKRPALKEDLKIDKLFLRYAYAFNKEFEINTNYIKIINDNLAITDKGQAFGLGLTYTLNKAFCTNFTQYYTHYDDFDTYQSDLNLEYKTKINGVKVKVNSITKYINIDEKNLNSFTKNAKNDYLTTGLKLHLHYDGYHFGSALYVGDRLFAIMNDGQKIQHHAMEFNRTYAVGIGKNISDFVIRLQYIYQKATEIPSHNENVEVSNIRFLLNYKI